MIDYKKLREAWTPILMRYGCRHLSIHAGVHTVQRIDIYFFGGAVGSWWRDPQTIKCGTRGRVNTSKELMACLIAELLAVPDLDLDALFSMPWMVSAPMKHPGVHHKTKGNK